MSKNFSPVSKLIGVFFHAVVIWGMFSLSYGWSLDQTIDFMSAVVGAESAPYAAYLIQFAPQVMLIIGAVALMNGNKRMQVVLVVGALVVNFLDFYTNIVTFREFWPEWSAGLIQGGRSADFVNATYPVGVVFTFLVTWFEEGISLALGSMLQLIAEFMEGQGFAPPAFFRASIGAARAAGFGGVNSIPFPTPGGGGRPGNQGNASRSAQNAPRGGRP